MGTLAVEGAEAVNMLGGKFKVRSKLLLSKVVRTGYQHHH